MYNNPFRWKCRKLWLQTARAVLCSGRRDGLRWRIDRALRWRIVPELQGVI